MSLMKTVFFNFDSNATKYITCIVTDGAIFRSNKCCFSSRPSVELLPSVEKLFDSGLRHRKHPGVRKLPPIQLPTNLLDAVYRLVSDEKEKSTLQEAEKLMATLASRRLPAEREEINMRLRKMLNLNEDDSIDTSDLLTKEETIKAKRLIQSEVSRWKPIEYTYFRCLAYIAGRLAPNYASTFKVFSEINNQLPTFKPKTFFDFGSGVGSAVWSANAVWGQSLEEYFCADASSDMNDVAETLLTDEKSGEKILKNLYFRQFLPASENIKYDLVVSAFSLLDLPSAEDRLRTIDKLWRKTQDILVIIEYGNVAGFYSVLDARDYILQLENHSLAGTSHKATGAHVLMPCPHESPCPMQEKASKNKTCGFYVAYEDPFPRCKQIVKKDWFSYVVLRKGQRYKDQESWPRIVQPVLKKSKFVICRACCSDGNLKELTITRGKHGRHAYRCARSSTLGDLLPLNIEQSTESEETLHKDEE